MQKRDIFTSEDFAVALNLNNLCLSLKKEKTKKKGSEIVCYFSGETPNSVLTREYYLLIEKKFCISAWLVVSSM